MNDEENIRQLVDRFFEGETTLAEERRLYRYFQGNDVAAELLPLREMFMSLGFIGTAPAGQTLPENTAQGRLKVGFRRRIVGVAAAVAVLLATGAALLHLDHEQNYCKAYVNGRLVTDRAAILNSVDAPMGDIGEAGQTGADRQLRDIFGGGGGEHD